MTNVKNYRKRFDTKNIYLGERDNFLINESRDKHIAHIGCTDWPDQISQMLTDNFLHSKLLKTARTVTGFDIDIEGISSLCLHFPMEKFIVGNIATDPEVRGVLIKLAPDVIIIPDVLEHVENAREFLLGLKSCLDEINVGRESNKTIAIFTTPNAYALKTFLPSLLGLDFTHPDHCLLHNEFTIRHVFADAGLRIHSVSYAKRSIRARYGRLASIVTIPIDLIGRLIPRFSDTLIVTVS
jgi:hypothetical protein